MRLKKPNETPWTKSALQGDICRNYVAGDLSPTNVAGDSIILLGGENMKNSSSINKFLGTWALSDEDNVEYLVTLKNDQIKISGLDTSDGEKLKITRVVFDGKELHFNSICPSTRYALTHVFRSIRGNTVEHEFTRVEMWKRKKAEPVRPANAAKRRG